jgi:hypothetical protein
LPTAKARFPRRHRTGRHPRGDRANLPVRQRETDRGRSEKRKLSTPRSAGLPPQGGVRGGRPLPSHSTRPELLQSSAVPPRRSVCRMVPPAPDAWASGAIAPIRTESLPTAVSVAGKPDFPSGEKSANTSPEPRISGLRDQAAVQEPRQSGPKCALFVANRSLCRSDLAAAGETCAVSRPQERRALPKMIAGRTR